MDRAGCRASSTISHVPAILSASSARPITIARQRTGKRKRGRDMVRSFLFECGGIALVAIVRHRRYRLIMREGSCTFPARARRAADGTEEIEKDRNARKEGPGSA